MMGVEYDLFWTLTPKSLTPFFKAFELKQDNNDLIAWQHGVYIQMAVASIMDSKNEYPKEPLSMINKKKEMLPKMSKTEQFKEMMLERMAIVNSQFEKEEGELINEPK